MDIEFLRECFSYNKDSGVLSWKERPLSHFKSESSSKAWHAKYYGRECGTVKLGHSGKKYLIINLNKRMLRVHRIIWTLMNGNIEHQIDHINGDGLDNRICNLREVTHLQNCHNMKLLSSNTSGCSGVSLVKSSGRWRAEIYVNNKKIHLGNHQSKIDAIKSRKDAEAKYGFHENHGQAREL